jgi:hypothetical protein
MSDEKTKRDVWRDIETKHFGQCVWQQRSPNGRGMLEGLTHRATGAIMIVEKMYDKRLPGESSSKPWPELIGLQVYAPVDGRNNTWDGLDAALAAFKQDA